MAHFRVEAAYDDASGLWFAEMFYPAESTSACARTGPIYASKETALEGAAALIEEAFGKSTKPLKPN
jgi:hypothetical protein